MAAGKKKTVTTKKKTEAKDAPTPIASQNIETPSELAKAMDALQGTLADFVISVLPGMMETEEWSKVPATQKWSIVKDVLPYILAKVQSVDGTATDDSVSNQLKQLAAATINKK